MALRLVRDDIMEAVASPDTTDRLVHDDAVFQVRHDGRNYRFLYWIPDAETQQWIDATTLGYPFICKRLASALFGRQVMENDAYVGTVEYGFGWYFVQRVATKWRFSRTDCTDGLTYADRLATERPLRDEDYPKLASVLASVLDMRERD